MVIWQNQIQWDGRGGNQKYRCENVFRKLGKGENK